MRSEFIDICRGIAILSVIFHHTFYFLIAGQQTSKPESLLEFNPYLFNNGWLGVNLFFILSGLVLYRPGIISTTQNIRKYYIARGKRLLPLYFLVIAGICLWEAKPLKFFAKSCLGLLTGVHDLMPGYWMPEDVLWVFWSLGVEILFSLMLPVLIILIGRFGFWRVFFAIITVSFVYRFIGDFLFLSSQTSYSSKFINPIKDNIIGRLDDFLIGMATAKWLWEKKQLPRFTIVLAIIGLLFTFHAWSWIAWQNRTPVMSLFVSVLHPIFSGSVMVILVKLSAAPIWNSRWFFPLSFAGVTCYSSYIVHGLLIKYLPSTFDFLNPAHLGIYFTVIFLTTTVLFLTIECWGMRSVPAWAERILRRKKPADSSATVITSSPMLGSVMTTGSRVG